MKIFYPAYVRLPTEKAHGLQIMKTCEALARAGAEVTLATPGRLSSIKETPFAFYDVEENFSIEALGTPDWIKLGKFGFALSSLWFSESARIRHSFLSADIVYSRDALVLMQYLLLGRLLVYEAHTEPTWVSTFVARRVYRVITISAGLRDAYIARGVRHDRIAVAHDAIDPKPFREVHDRAAERARLGIPPDKVIALYVGRIDVPKGAGTAARVSEHLPDTHRIVLIGAGPIREELERQYPKALVLGETPYRDLARVLSTADILVAPNSAEDVNASLYTSPLKAFAYLAAKKPIVASDVPALRAIFEDAAEYVRPDEPKDLARAILDPHVLTRVHTKEPYTWDSRARDILAALSLT